MKKIISITLSLAMLITMLAGCSKKEVYRLIKVNSFEGAVTVEREEKMEVFKGLQLVSEDSVAVGEDSLLELLADSDKHIVAGENTAFTLHSTGTETSGNITIDLLYGKSFFTIDNKLPDGSTFEVNTPNASLSVRGTTFSVVYDAETETTSVEVIEGIVAVTNSEETEELTAGESATITSKGIELMGKTEGTVEEEITEEVTEETEPAEETEEAEEEPKKIIKSSKTTYYQKDGTIDNYYIEEYDSDGNLIKFSSFDADGTLNHSYINEYDSDGNLIKSSSFDADGTLNYYYIDEYDSDGNPIKSNNFNADGTLSFYWTYEYDSDGNQIKSSYFYADQTFSFYSTYEYDSDGNRIRSNDFNDNGTLSSYVIYENDENGNQIKSISYNADGTLEYYTIYQNEYWE